MVSGAAPSLARSGTDALGIDRRLGLDGEPAAALETTMAAARMRLVLETVPGELAHCPGLGWPGHFLPELASPAARAVAAVLAEATLRRWLPELAVERVELLEGSEGEVPKLRAKVSCGGRWEDVEWRWRAQRAPARASEASAP